MAYEEEEGRRVTMETKHIPEEMVVNILQNLPEEGDLARFKCVSKQWRRWITDIIETRPRKQKLALNSENYDLKTMDPKTWQLENMVASVPWKTIRGANIYSSCNGLLLVGGGDDLFIWNPLTRYIEKIFSFYMLCDCTVVGFCLDSSTNEYKVIVALAYESPGNGDFVAVGSPKNKSWTHIDFPYCPRTVGSGPVLNNRLHWFASSGGFRSPYAIIYFDTKTDTFLELPMPLTWDTELNNNVVLGLGVLDGCLCMTRPEDNYGDRAEILVMKVYGVRESWTVLFRINGIQFRDDIVPFFYIDEGKSQVCMKITDDRYEGTDKIVTYDVNSNSQIDTIATKIYCTVAYEVTSVKPVRGDWEELDSRGEAYYTHNYGFCIRTLERHELDFWHVVKEEWVELEIEQYHSEVYQEEEEEDWEVPNRRKCKKKSSKISKKKTVELEIEQYHSEVYQEEEEEERELPNRRKCKKKSSKISKKKKSGKSKRSKRKKKSTTCDFIERILTSNRLL